MPSDNPTSQQNAPPSSTPQTSQDSGSTNQGSQGNQSSQGWTDVPTAGLIIVEKDYGPPRKTK